MIFQAVDEIRQNQMPMVFRKQNLKRFLSEILLLEDPRLSFSNNAVEIFPLIFGKFILEKIVYDYWKIKNDHKNFKGWTDTMLNDKFMKDALSDTYEYENTFLYR